MSIPFGNNILRAMVYFDLFQYPLTIEEIHQYLNKKAALKDLEKDLAKLSASSLIYKFGQFYSLRKDVELVYRRLRGNGFAKKMLPQAIRISNFLFQFPFVRGVGISGSLSKNFADEFSDIDYFIVTKSGRLWIARTIMHLFKKLTYLTGRQHFYCMNYFVDKDGMQIEEKNIFTATELKTLIPVCGNETMDSLFEANNWVNLYFPNHDLNEVRQKTRKFGNAFKAFTEWIFDHSLFDALEKWLMNVTAARWKKKEDQNKINRRGTKMGLQVNRHFAKPNPVFFQQKILQVYAARLTKFENKWAQINSTPPSDSFSKCDDEIIANILPRPTSF
ncbi:MAG: hypothetical protein ACHQET_01205 [Chitinophagales bacterium]